MGPLADRAAEALASGRLDLPRLGAGRTAERWWALIDLAIDDVDLARLAEAHVDGQQILVEAGVDPPSGQLLGVWASEHPAATVTVVPDAAPGRIRLSGLKAFCSGAGIVDAALVTATTPAGTLLVQVPGTLLGEDRIDDSDWKVRALGEVRTATVDLEGIVLPASAVVGGPGWYLDRPGFWDGALGPAACWAGTAIGLVRVAADRASDDPHSLAHLGAMSAAERTLFAIFESAGRAQDVGDLETKVVLRRALEVRHSVDAIGADIGERFARCLGPRALAFDAAIADRVQALGVYRRQCHGERDLERIGAVVRGGSPSGGRPFASV